MAAAPKKDDLKTKFETAAAAVKQTKKRPDNATLMKLYSYYKQATSAAIAPVASTSSAAPSTMRGRSSRA